jgi:hypothetical protein
MIQLIGKPLFKIDQHDSIQIYQCYVERFDNDEEIGIVRRYGLLNGKLQINRLLITSGKNIGKSNETTPLEQAIAEATSFYNEKKDQGYTAFKKTTEDFGKIDDIDQDDLLPIVPFVKRDYYDKLYQALVPFKNKGHLGRVLPMLAQDPFKGGKEEYDLNNKTVKRELKKRLEFPVAVQCKFDGARCIVDCRDIDRITLTSREGKDWTKVHYRIVNELKKLLKEGKLKPLLYDCELYSDASFQDTIGLIKAPDNYPIFADSLYLVCYDVVDTEKSFQGRFITEVHNHYIKNPTSLKSTDGAVHKYSDVFRIAVTYTCQKLSQIKELHDEFVKRGYEGAMIRILEGRYEPDKRSKNLLKYKVFSCDEFEITKVIKKKKEVVFECIIQIGNDSAMYKRFDCTPPGTKAENKEIEANPDQYIGKLLTVKYFGLTNDGLPRFPKAHAIRDYETPDDEDDDTN